MPGTPDSLDYEQFDYKFYDQEPLSLEEATKKAAALREHDKNLIFRIVAANRDTSKFYVDSVSKAEMQADLWTRFLNIFLKFRTAGLLRNG